MLKMAMSTGLAGLSVVETGNKKKSPNEGEAEGDFSNVN